MLAKLIHIETDYEGMDIDELEFERQDLMNSLSEQRMMLKEVKYGSDIPTLLHNIHMIEAEIGHIDDLIKVVSG